MDEVSRRRADRAALDVARRLVATGRADAVPPDVLARLEAEGIAPTATATTGPPTPDGGFRSTGEIVRGLLPRFAALRERSQAERLRFVAEGGRCVHCWDTGGFGTSFCDRCLLGQQRQHKADAALVALLIRQAGIGWADGRTTDNWADAHGRAEPREIDGRERLALRVSAWAAASPVAMKPGLILTGPKGTGKSSLAAAVLRDTIHATKQAGLRITEKEYLDALKPGPDEDKGIRQRAWRVPLLVIDDLGIEKQTTFTEGERLGLINHRYENRLWTILTTNYGLHSDFLIDAIGERVQDRLVEMCEVVQVVGRSLRR